MPVVQDTLYLLTPGYDVDGHGPHFCADCATVEGFLVYYPQLAGRFAVERIGFPRPRPELVPLLGDDHQGCPVLILAASSAADADLPVQTVNGQRFIDEPKAILRYLGRKHGVGTPS
ncbi:DUF3088 family protein [Jeongeupia naejangsanensis]|uniref:DUF3088 family protein n=1 Tax=Jeongeupia naejangsanensis TaxID=613195 RepID=A0ABS2BKZ9_9NEIS|nr:DUF3088 family protein [Jeongeupia naejangsanensis]MBM3116263.1 DUF3088 family protein [Jeongeupia naejangsanensis]